MKTVVVWLLAAAILSVTSAHAASIRQDDSLPDAREATRQLLQPQDGLHDDHAGSMSMTPAGFRSFYGVDLSTASPAARDPAPGDGRLAHAYPDSRAYRPREPAAASTAAQEGTPEPGTIAILSFGLAGLALASRKKA